VSGVHICPWCRCGPDRGPIIVDTSAPGYQLVLEVDQILFDQWIARRTAARAQRRAEAAA
jgi:hypothetical protein